MNNGWWELYAVLIPLYARAPRSSSFTSWGRPRTVWPGWGSDSFGSALLFAGPGLNWPLGVWPLWALEWVEHCGPRSFCEGPSAAFSLAKKCIQSVGSRFLLRQGGFVRRVGVKPLLAGRGTFSLEWALKTEPLMSWDSWHDTSCVTRLDVSHE